MPSPALSQFDLNDFLITPGPGRSLTSVRAGERLFSQGERRSCVFYLQSGRARITVLARSGKEAIITELASGDFVGEDCMAPPGGLRLTSAVALTDCHVLRFDRETMLSAMRDEHSFANHFLEFLLKRSMRAEADLVDQIFNNSEKRLARILLRMAELPEAPWSSATIPAITQDALADMVGTTRSRISFFMNRFRKLGFIKYKGRIEVHRSLLEVVRNA